MLKKNLLPANKLATTFGKTKYKVLERRGHRAIVENQDTGVKYERNIAHLKKINIPQTSTSPMPSHTTRTETSQKIIEAPAIEDAVATRFQEDEPPFRGFEEVEEEFIGI